MRTTTTLLLCLALTPAALAGERGGYTCEPGASGPKRVAPAPPLGPAISLSPDGGAFVDYVVVGPPPELSARLHFAGRRWVLGPANRRALTWTPRWSPSGRYVVVEGSRGFTLGLLRAATIDRMRQLLGTSPSTVRMLPRWSRMSVLAVAWGHGPQRPRLYATVVAGPTEPREVSTGRLVHFDPSAASCEPVEVGQGVLAFAPLPSRAGEGRAVLALVGGGSVELLREGKERHVVGSTKGQNSAFVVASDPRGREAAVCMARREVVHTPSMVVKEELGLYLLRRDTEAPQLEAIPGKAPRAMAYSPTGEHLALVHVEALSLIRRPGSHMPKSFPAPKGQHFSELAWAPDGSSLAVITEREVWLYPLEGTPQLLFRAKEGALRSLHWGGRLLAWTLGSPDGASPRFSRER